MRNVIRIAQNGKIERLDLPDGFSLDENISITTERQLETGDIPATMQLWDNAKNEWRDVSTADFALIVNRLNEFMDDGKSFSSAVGDMLYVGVQRFSRDNVEDAREILGLP